MRIKNKLISLKHSDYIKMKKSALGITSMAALFTLGMVSAFAAGTEFFETAIDTLGTIVIALGAGLGVWGVINLLEGYGSDNPGSKSQGVKQLVAGTGVAVVGAVLIPMLSDMFEF